MQPDAPCYCNRYCNRHYAEIAIRTGHAKGDFRCVRCHWRDRRNEVRQFVHGPGEIVQPAVRIAGGEKRRRMSGEFLCVTRHKGLDVGLFDTALTEEDFKATFEGLAAK